jgi:long-chain acyl-CoA synthetase
MQLHEVMQNALERPAHTRAVEYHDEWYSWGWLRHMADVIEEALAGGGVQPGARVGVIARNRPAFVGALLSLIASQRSIVMIYAFQSPSAIAEDIRKLNLDAIIADSHDWADEVTGAAREAGALSLAIDGTHNSVRRVNERSPSEAAPLSDTSSAAIEMLTSGTTGTPKRIALSFVTIARSMVGESTQRAQSIPDGTQLAPALIMFPFGNISGLYSYFPMAASGRPVVLLDKFDVAKWIDFIRRYRPQQMNIPPAGVHMVLDANIPAEDLSSIQFIASGAAWLDPNAQREFLRRYGIPILLSYGATEFGGVVTAMTPDLFKEFGNAKLESVGRPWAGTQLRVVDSDTGTELRAGETGILEILTPHCGPDWIRTTDLAALDADGFVYHRGRADGAIMRGGYKIIPEAVAEKMSLHPSIATIAVVGLPDHRLGEIPVAALELRPGQPRPSDDELRAHARRHLYSTHVPVHFRIVDRLPRTPSMKIYLPGVKSLFSDIAADASLPGQAVSDHRPAGGKTS